MDSLEFQNLNDPNHAMLKTQESFNEEVNYLLGQIFENNEVIQQKPLQSNFYDSLISEPDPDKDETSLILAAYLMFNILTQDDVDVLYDKIMSMTDDFPDSEWRPKLIYSNWEAGYWILKCADQLSKRWFMEKISEQPIMVGDVSTNINVVPMKNLPTFYSEVDIKGQIVSDDKILSRFAKQNKEIGLSTSRWTDLKCIPEGSNKYKLCLEIDLLSSKRIKANGSKLFFGMGSVDFKIQDNLEAAAIDIIATELTGMNY